MDAVTPPAPVYATYTAPWITIYKLLMRFNAGGTDYWYVCSASAVSSFHLLTAGHCLYNHDIRNNKTNVAGWAQEIWVWPGATDQVSPTGQSDFPWGTAKATYIRTYNGWINSGDFNLDMGYITLDRRIGDRSGWMGREWGITATLLNFSGYPTETPYVPAGNLFQYYGADAGNVTGYTANRINLAAYIYGGHSGGPAWRLTDGNRYIQGVNSTSNRAGSAQETRFTSGYNSDLVSFISEDSSQRAPVARPDLIEYVFDSNYKDLLTASVSPGGTASVRFNVMNTGFAVSGPVTVDFYLSPNTIISTSDIYVGSLSLSSLDALAATTGAATFTVPGGTATGDYYVGWIMRCTVGEYWNGGALGSAYSYDDNTGVVGNKTLKIGTPSVPDLTVTKTHAGSFTRGQVGATYTIVVRNAGTGPTSGTVTLSDSLPSGLTATALSGSGWVCTVGTLTCTRTDSLAAGASYPAVTLTVTVSATAPGSVTNIANVSGGGQTNTSNDQASDPTTILNAATPDLTIQKTHAGNFQKGQTGATYTITVSNAGTGPTSGTVTVNDSVPAGLTATSIAGTGWSCTQPKGPCTRSNVLNVGSSYPSLTLTVNVASNASSSVTNTATVSGGGETNTANNTAHDLTTISTVTAVITIVNGDPAGVGFNDTTPTAPVGGNTGTTLGQQRLLAFQAAAEKWGSTLSSSVPIRIRATWEALECTSSSAVLGSAGAAGVFRDFQNAPVASRWYPKALANKLAGVDLDPSTPDINARFNVNLGKAGCLTGRFYYLGLDNNHGDQINLVTVLLHEFGHGLGFQTFTNRQTGARYLDYPSVWDDFLLDNVSNKTWAQMTNAERVASAVSAGRLVWNGAAVRAAVPQVLTAQGGGYTGADGMNRPKMYAPNPFVPGSSVSHYDTSLSRNQLMEPAINYDLTHELKPPIDLSYSLMQDIGWTSTGPAPVPDLTIAKTHTGNFTQGQTGATYALTVRNSGAASTSGTVSVTDTVPSGLTATSIAGTGWSCTQPAGPCTRTNALAANTNYPVITLTVSVAANAASSVTNTATVSGGGETNTANNTATDPTTISPGAKPDLTITKTHSGNFSQGQTGATYTLTVRNSGAASTSGTVTVTDTVPSGLTATSMAGTGWSCTQPAGPCTRGDALAVNTNYPAITLTVSVAANAASSVTNTAAVSGGGETNTANNTATDPTTINPGAKPDLTITKTHSGNFTHGQTGATYTLTVRNSGAASTSGTVTVTDTVPSGLTATSIAGTGWSCTQPAGPCTRTDALAVNTNYPVITLTVSVAANAASSVTNTAAVSGGGETNTANNTATDPTTINPGAKPDLTITKTHSGNFSQGQTGATYTLTVRNSGAASTSGTVTVTDTVPSGLTATSIAGTGWSCTQPAGPCTRTNALAANTNYPVITLTVSVAANAPSSVTNTATVSGGGETNTANNTATDPTTISPGAKPDLTITKTHSGNFSQGQIGATYMITVRNSGAASTSGTVTVTDTVPSGLTATSIAGTGWSCTQPAGPCTRTNALAANTNYPVITLTVSVAANAASSVTNTATVSGGGETNTANNTATDVTLIDPAVVTILQPTAAPISCNGVGAGTELGVKFRADVPGRILGIRFFKNSVDTSGHTGTLWSAAGAALATGVFTGESASGWQEMRFASPVIITANTTYVASYHTKGWYCLTAFGFNGAGVDNPPLRALKDGVDGPNGVYANSANGGVMPTLPYASSNFFVDVLFVPTPPQAVGSLVAVSGTPQTTPAGTSFAATLQARVRDTNSNPIVGAQVTFNAPASGPRATFNGSPSIIVPTDSSGIATSPVPLAGARPGTYVVTASISGFSAPFTLTNSTLTPSVIAPVSGTPQSAPISTSFGAALRVKVTNSANLPVADATVTFTAPGSGASARFNGNTTATAVTDESGVATSPIPVANATLGTYTVVASLTGLGSTASFSLSNITPPSITVTVAPKSVILYASEKRTFTATVIGSSNTGVTWSISPNVGSLSGGTYTAPSAIAANQTVILTATSIADSTVKDTATIRLKEPDKTIFAADAAPLSCNGMGSGTELGVKFRSDEAGQIRGIRFYKNAMDNTTHTGSLWSSSGARLATGTFINETAAGWQTLIFAAPVDIAANTTYVASYHTGGWFCSTAFAFMNAGVDTPPLHALKDGTSGPNGVSISNVNGGVMPSTGNLATNYWVDVLFTKP